MADEHDMRSKGSPYETIKTEQDGATFILTLHRPQKRNIINKQMRAEVVDALMKVRADASVRAIIVWGGPEVFAAGADLSEMR
ncbi:MAG: enoyl-CoA hydratase/isomerase family protein, partial [Chloroflexi bacterium]